MSGISFLASFSVFALILGSVSWQIIGTIWWFLCFGVGGTWRGRGRGRGNCGTPAQARLGPRAPPQRMVECLIRYGLLGDTIAEYM